MLSKTLDLEKIEASKIFDYLYDIFYNDFIKSKTYLNNTIYINPQTYKKDEGKELCFWHLTTREQIYIKKEGSRIIKIKERLPDFERASRIHWIKPIIENCFHTEIKLFYKKETRGKKPIRLYLWAYNKDFVVILQKLGKSSSFLVTSFYITHRRKREDFQKYYEVYVKKLNPLLKGCEWF